MAPKQLQNDGPRRPKEPRLAPKTTQDGLPDIFQKAPNRPQRAYGLTGQDAQDGPKDFPRGFLEPPTASGIAQGATSFLTQTWMGTRSASLGGNAFLDTSAVFPRELHPRLLRKCARWQFLVARLAIRALVANLRRQVSSVWLPFTSSVRSAHRAFRKLAGETFPIFPRDIKRQRVDSPLPATTLKGMIGVRVYPLGARRDSRSAGSIRRAPCGPRPC